MKYLDGVYLEKKKILVIGDRYTVSMFNLLGIDGVVVEDRDPMKIRKILDAYIGSGEFSIIYITKELGDLLKDYIDKISATRRWPVITILPTRWSKTEEIDVSSLLRKALGVG